LAIKGQIYILFGLSLGIVIITYSTVREPFAKANQSAQHLEPHNDC